MEFDPKVFDSLKYWQHFQFAASKSHCLDANEEASVIRDELFHVISMQVQNLVNRGC